MKVFIFSDGHGQMENLKQAKTFIKKGGYELLLFAGDFTKFGQEKTGLAYLEEILSWDRPFFSVMGNCDYPSLLELGREKGALVDGRVAEHKGFFISGTGGGSFFTGASPYERHDEEFARDLSPAETKVLSKEIDSNRLIVLSHNPPHNSNLDIIAGGAHVGSPGIRQFLERTQPLLFVSGHIHEAVGQDTIGKTTLINPGSLADGRFATCEILETESGFKLFGIGFVAL